eukprot:SAG22_NODE_412_length_10893_cov_14.851770_4_plen_86_part_00
MGDQKTPVGRGQNRGGRPVEAGGPILVLRVRKVKIGTNEQATSIEPKTSLVGPELSHRRHAKEALPAKVAALSEPEAPLAQGGRG